MLSGYSFRSRWWACALAALGLFFAAPFALAAAHNDERGAARRRARCAKLFAARRTFRYSIVYLALLFAALLADHYV
jgi:heme O synthase-like polyprenyltransferase